jgi:hypothetical protein
MNQLNLMFHYFPFVPMFRYYLLSQMSRLSPMSQMFRYFPFVPMFRYCP